jgi:hypothetical protein
MESKKVKILTGMAMAVLVVVELTLLLRFRLPQPFYLSMAVILSIALVGPGSLRTVFCSVLDDGTVVAVKRVVLLPQGRRRQGAGGARHGRARPAR